MSTLVSQYRGSYYNKEQKAEFLSLQSKNMSSNQIKFVTNKLKAISAYEKSINMDICDWSQAKIIALLKDLFMYTEDIVEFYSVFLKPYCSHWGKEINIEVDNLKPTCIEQMPKNVSSIIRQITSFGNSHTQSTLALANALAILSWYGADISSQTIDCIDNR